MRLVAERPTYSRTELISSSQVPPGSIKPEVWRKLSRWGLLVPRYWPTRRSRRGGVGKPRQINTGCKSPTPPHAFMQDLDSDKVDLVVTGCESKSQTQPAERHTCKNWECQQIQCVVTPYRVNAPQPGFVNHLNLTTVTVNKWELPTFVNTNIHGGLAAKLDEVSVTLQDNHVDIVCITETWCSNKVPDAAISLADWTTIRRDRQDGRLCGGILCYIRDGIPFHHWKELDCQDLETVVNHLPSVNALQLSLHCGHGSLSPSRSQGQTYAWSHHRMCRPHYSAASQCWCHHMWQFQSAQRLVSEEQLPTEASGHITYPPAGNVGQGVHQHGCPLCRYQHTPPWGDQTTEWCCARPPSQTPTSLLL